MEHGNEQRNPVRFKWTRNAGVRFSTASSALKRRLIAKYELLLADLLEECIQAFDSVPITYLCQSVFVAV